MTTNSAANRKPAGAKSRREIKVNFVTIEDGKSVEGKLVSRRTVKFPNGDVGSYTLQSDNGDEFSILGSTQLDTLLSQVEDGEYVWVTHVGETRTSSGRKMRTWKVEVAE